MNNTIEYDDLIPNRGLGFWLRVRVRVRVRG
jgi:hypothetical protein